MALKVNFSRNALEACKKMGVDIASNDKVLERQMVQIIKRTAKAILEANEVHVDLVDTETDSDSETAQA